MSKPAVADQQVERRIARSEMISKVAGGVVHNFNNILSVLLGRVELMLGQVDGGRLDPTQLRKGLVSIQKGALDAAELLKRLRDLSRPPQDVPSSTFDLNAAVIDAIDFLQPHLLTVAQGRGVLVRLTPHLARPAVLVSGQSSALREVLMNLILNAIEAMPEGGEVVIETLRDDGGVKLKVSDTGIGMSEEVRAQVFLPFFTTKSAGSTGLGLSSAKDLITGHGGTISVQSEAGRGSTFTIALPSAETRRAPVAAVAEPTLPAGLRVLVVDDERDFGDILREFLGTKGCSLAIVGNGRVALEVLERQPFELVLTDLLLPEVSGWEIARVAKRRSPNCRVILMSGKIVPEEVWSEARVDACLMKPIDLNKLLEVIAEVVARTLPRDA
jgi:two-component system cell cycle sensor histidine kinase/response regulator CckA